MNEKVNKFIHSRVFIIILILVLICTTLLVGTYAWFTWSSTDNTTLVMSLGEFADVYFKNGNDITGELAPVFEYTDGLSTEFSISNRDDSGALIGYNVNFNIDTIDSELISEDVKWVLVKNGSVVGEGNLSTVSDGSSITLDSGTLFTGTTSYVFYLYIDGNVENDPNMMGKTITGNIMVEANGNGANLLNHITSLYANADKTVVTNNSIDYNYATSVNLMNDRLGDATVDADSGNIRYYGANPNNYIYFNCSDYSNQTSDTCETWRIIGIVDGKVKLIRSESIGGYSWDYTSTGEYDNNWSDATLNTLLNDTYYNSGTTTYYNGSTTGTTVDFSTNGITVATRNSNLISSSTWYINGMSEYDVYSNVSYAGERTGSSTWLDNIGLAYPSDYGYSADLNSCTKTIFNYDAEECTSVNWLTPIFTVDSYYWLITPFSDNSFTNVWSVMEGYVTGDDGFANYMYDVVPVLYLDSELVIESGTDGSNTNPYRINVS